MSTTSAGYSGTPLARKLGIKPGMRLCALAAPTNYGQLLAPLPDDLHWQAKPSLECALVHAFFVERQVLAAALRQLRETLATDAVLWVSWPKRSAGVATDITEDVIRDEALPLGWVDVKVCAVDATWSALKLVVRKQLR